MKNRNKFFPYLSFFSRITLSLIFLISGISKLIEIPVFRWELVSLKLFYWVLAEPLAYIIPIFEVIIAILLALGLFDKFVSIHLGIFIVALTIVSLYANYILNLENCKCFGILIDMKYDIWHMIFLAVLFILNVFVFFDREKKWTILKGFENQKLIKEENL